ncbi:MAG TPA: serine hydrolase domain-containing protein, partial [Chitinophagaceae bacterium]|nr:serine hydrolase domain-containing protein [Chitinophagaceae bacterium]
IFGDTIPKMNIEERMNATGIKGLSIAVIRNYKIEWAKGYGWADVEEKRKVTTATRFQAASISKSVNSMGILKLVQMGKLDPEADINNYFKSWKFPYDSVSKSKKISTHNLLSHTAGLDIHGFPGYKRMDTLPTIQQILDGKRPANTKAVRSLFEPGTKFKYSGGGTTITQLMLTDITGSDYADWMQKNVLQPLGMTNSSYRQPSADTVNLATGYYGNGQPVTGKYHVYPEQAAAGLWTTPSDLAKYIIECQLALVGKSQQVLSTAMMKKRLTPYIDSAAALGVFIDKRKGQSWFNHNGGNEAFLCTSYGSMEGGNGVVIMINGENFAVISELLNSVATVYDWKGFYNPTFKKTVRVPNDSLQQYTGRYLLMKDTLTILFCGDDLCIQQNGEPETGYQMHFTDHNNFSIREVPNAAFTILRNATGKVDALQLKQGDANLRLPRID